MRCLWDGRRVASGLQRMILGRIDAHRIKIAEAGKDEGTEALNDSKGEVVVCIRSRAKYLSIVRGLVAALCADTPLGESDVEDLTLAVGEAVANALRHGSPHGSSDLIVVCCRVNQVGVTVEVRDRGTGIVDTGTSIKCTGGPSVGGYGIPLMRQLSDFFEIDSGHTGTTVTISKYFPVVTGGT